MEDVKAVILAGGKGTRLRPYTTVFPKPLMPIGQMPILEVVLRQLKHYGFRDITLSVNHLADLIKTFFADGDSLGLNITYCMEERPLGTAGSLSLVENITDNFLVMNGDLLTTLDYSEIVKAHLQSGADATIGVFPREVTIDFGVLKLDQDNKLIDYIEKPKYQYRVSMGVNVFNKSVTEFIPKNQYLDIPTLMMTLRDNEKTVMAYQSQCRWLDIGRPDDYEQAVVEFEKNKNEYLPH